MEWDENQHFITYLVIRLFKYFQPKKSIKMQSLMYNDGLGTGDGLKNVNTIGSNMRNINTNINLIKNFDRTNLALTL